MLRGEYDNAVQRNANEFLSEAPELICKFRR